MVTYLSHTVELVLLCSLVLVSQGNIFQVLNGCLLGLIEQETGWTVDVLSMSESLCLKIHVSLSNSPIMHIQLRMLLRHTTISSLLISPKYIRKCLCCKLLPFSNAAKPHGWIKQLSTHVIGLWSVMNSCVQGCATWSFNWTYDIQMKRYLIHQTEMVHMSLWNWKHWNQFDQ